MEKTTEYPLCWPSHKPRTTERKYGRFGTKSTNTRGWKQTDDITIAQALRRIGDELQTMDGAGRNWQRIIPDSIVISTNLKVRKSDGQPASGQKEPSDPGAALYFVMDGHHQCVAVDSYTKVAQNLAAIAAVISALRSLDRHGSGLMEAAFTGFTALPPAGSAMETEAPWYVVLDVDADDAPEIIERAYKYARSAAHPDRGGNDTQFNRVQRAWEQYQQNL